MKNLLNKKAVPQGVDYTIVALSEDGKVKVQGGTPTPPPTPSIPNNEIWYTTTNGNIIELSEYWGGEELISNTYEDGKGIMVFANDVTDITKAFDMEHREEDETQLLSVTLPNSIEIIGECAFYGCIYLPSIEMPSGVTSIEPGAFHFCRSLTSIVIPNSVTSISISSFYSCTSLTSATIGSGVTSIDMLAFSKCSSLTSVTYNGTMEEWNAISKGSDWKTDVPSTCMVHCTDGDISIADA